MLDEKVSRLPPEEQRMVEEFVAFLLHRYEQGPQYSSPIASVTGYQEKAPAKPIIMAEETQINRERDILPDYKDLGELTSEPAREEVSGETVRVRVPKVPTNKLLDWID